MKKLLFLFMLFMIPCFVYAEELIPNAKSGILIEASSGKIIYEKDKDKELSVASMTKMVAQIIVLEEVEKNNIKWSDKVKVSRNASSMGGSQIYLEEGEEITVEDLMKGVSISSGNDAVVALAEYISGSEEKFVKRMNDKVKELGLKHTKFSNSTGLDQENHYSSSYDMAMIARDLVINHSEILKFSSIYEDYLRENTDKKFWLVNTNKLISQYDGCDGLKTGHTDDALYCLAATAKRSNVRLIAIVLGEDDSKVRNSETIDLLDYGFNNIKVKTLKNKGEVIKNIKLSKANKKSIDLVLKEDLNVISSDNSKKKYKYNIKINNIKLPINKNDKLGVIEVVSNNKVISKGDIITTSSVSKLNLFNLYIRTITNYIVGVL